MKLLFFLALSADVFAEDLVSPLNAIKETSSCRKNNIDLYVNKCTDSGSQVYVFFSGDLIMCNKRPYTYGALSLTAPADPLVREALKIVSLCTGEFPLYYNPSAE